jgi:hypothetical protein
MPQVQSQSCYDTAQAFHVPATNLVLALYVLQGNGSFVADIQIPNYGIMKLNKAG